MEKRQLDGKRIQSSGMANGTNLQMQYPIAFPAIETIYKELDAKIILPGSKELFNRVDTLTFFRRLDDLWPEVEKQVKFLRIIIATVSTSQNLHQQLIVDFLIKILDSNLIDYMVKKHILPMHWNTEKRSGQNLELIDCLILLLTIGYNVLPSKMDSHIEHVLLVLTTLKGINKENFISNNAIENLEKQFNTRIEVKAASIQPENSQKSNSRKIIQGTGAPPEDFRNLSIMPDKYDIIDVKSIYLRPNIYKYKNTEHYLDIHFRLLREDLLRPLREGIQEYRESGVQETDLFVYKDIRLNPPIIDKFLGELIYYAHLKLRKKVRWNKRLKFGSLVCLSRDDFQENFVFAVVKDREHLHKSIVGLRFENPREIDLKAEYRMVESPSFFEAYKHVMLALQSIQQGENIPFKDYLLGKTNLTNIPTYLLLHEELDFKSLIKGSKGPNVVYLSDFFTKFDGTSFGMDQSQLEALHYALTSDLAVIQGPPGTGKTFIGLQITRLLLENAHLWNATEDSPILVVCYTNHALDQFLEGILKFLKEGIVRIGNRSKSLALEEYTLYKARQRFGERHRTHSFSNYLTAQRNLTSLKNKLVEENMILNELQSGIANPQLRELRDVMQIYFGKSFFNGNETYINDSIFHWLTHATVKVEPKLEPNMDIVQELMRLGFEEIPSKNASFKLYGRSVMEMAEFLSQNKFNKKESYIYTKLLLEIQHWPKVEDFNNLLQNYKIPSEVALQMLLSSNGNIDDILNELNLAQSHLKVADEVAREDGPLFESVAIQDEELHLYKDDEERERMIYDKEAVEILDNDKIKNDKGNNNIKNKENKTETEKKKWYPQDKMKIFGNYIISSLPISEDSVAEIETNIKDVWKLSLQTRWRLFQFWHSKSAAIVEEAIGNLANEILLTSALVSEYRANSDLEVLQDAKIIGMTTTGAAIHKQTLRKLKPKIVIFEEAAEILEAHLVTSLTDDCQHAILIGDHQQLRPNPSSHELATKYKLEISLFERLVTNQFPKKVLKNQHRMRPEISNTLMPHFYENLENDSSVYDYPHVRGIEKDMIFFNHNHSEVNGQEFKSRSNPFEAQMAICLAKYFKQQNYRDDQITILCTYLEQLIYLRSRVETQFPELKGIRIENVDNYQGEESDIIILSLVRSNNLKKKIGFLNISNRVCVALSRAKIGLYVLANMDFLAENCDNGLWQRIKTSVEEAGALLNHFPIKCQNHSTEQVKHS